MGYFYIVIVSENDNWFEVWNDETNYYQRFDTYELALKTLKMLDQYNDVKSPMKPDKDLQNLAKILENL